VRPLEYCTKTAAERAGIASMADDATVELDIDSEHGTGTHLQAQAAASCDAIFKVCLNTSIAACLTDPECDALKVCPYFQGPK